MSVTDDKLNNVQLIDELIRLRKENARLAEEREILKSRSVFRQGGTKNMMYEYIEKQQKYHLIELLCDVLEVSRSGYYSFLTRGVKKMGLDTFIGFIN